MCFGYAIGVLHHVPDTQAGIGECVRRLKPGAPFLLYLYYAFDNRPAWFRLLWRISNLVRVVVSRLPFWLRSFLSELAAACIYWPFARSARLAERLGFHIQSFPLSAYRDRSFYQMRNDALDRFGTRIEKIAAKRASGLRRRARDSKSATATETMPAGCRRHSKGRAGRARPASDGKS